MAYVSISGGTVRRQKHEPPEARKEPPESAIGPHSSPGHPCRRKPANLTAQNSIPSRSDSIPSRSDWPRLARRLTRFDSHRNSDADNEDADNEDADNEDADNEDADNEAAQRFLPANRSATASMTKWPP
jgi:hypothetical protein